MVPSSVFFEILEWWKLWKIELWHRSCSLIQKPKCQHVVLWCGVNAGYFWRLPGGGGNQCHGDKGRAEFPGRRDHSHRHYWRVFGSTCEKQPSVFCRRQRGEWSEEARGVCPGASQLSDADIRLHSPLGDLSLSAGYCTRHNASRSIPAMAKGESAFCFTAAQYPTVWMHRNLVTHPSNAQVGCLRIGAVLSNAAMNTGAAYTLSDGCFGLLGR